MINAAFMVWVALRITRWISWMSFLAYSFAITISADRSSHLDHFGRPLFSTEAWLFGLPMLAVALGLFELMTRAGGHRETRLLPADAAKSAPFELTGTGDGRGGLLWYAAVVQGVGQAISGATDSRGPRFVLDIAFGLPAHQPSRPKHERLAAIVRKARRSPYSSPSRS